MAPSRSTIHSETIFIIDFGSQYSHLIARRVREQNVYCEIIPHTTSWESIGSNSPKGIILSGHIPEKLGTGAFQGKRKISYVTSPNVTSPGVS